jgi:hypothetical protein
MTKYEPKTEQVVYNGQMWAATTVLIDAVQKAVASGGGSAQSIVAALHTMTNVTTDIVPRRLSSTAAGPQPVAPASSAVACA